MLVIEKAKSISLVRGVLLIFLAMGVLGVAGLFANMQMSAQAQGGADTPLIFIVPADGDVPIDVREGDTFQIAIDHFVGVPIPNELTIQLQITGTGDNPASPADIAIPPITIPAGSPPPQRVAIQVLVDGIVEPLETFQISIPPSTTGAYDIPPPNPTRTRAKIPNFAPTNILLETKHLSHIIRTTSEKSGFRRGAMPEGTHQIIREVAITNTTTKPASSEYSTMHSVNKTKHTIFWQDSDANRFGWLVTKFANSRGETGPPSTPLMLPII